MIAPAVVLVASTLWFAPGPFADDEAEIREAFEAYMASVLERDAERAVELVDTSTVDYYAEMRRKALEADEAEVRRCPVLDKVTILRLRHQVGTERMAELDGPGVFKLGVEEGWVGDESMRRQGIGEIEVEGDSASGVVLVGGNPTPIKHHFSREGGAWKVNLTKLLEVMNPALEEAAEENEMTVDEFVVFLLEAVSGEEVPDTIWQKPEAPEPAPAGPGR